MKANFELVDSSYISACEVRADLHNDFDFLGVVVDWEDRTATLSWRRTSGEWVAQEAPSRLRVVFRNVTFLLMNLGEEQGDPRTMDAAGYIRHDAPATEQGFLPERLDASDHVVFMWDSGAYLRVYAEMGVLETIP